MAVGTVVADTVMVLDICAAAGTPGTVMLDMVAESEQLDTAEPQRMVPQLLTVAPVTVRQDTQERPDTMQPRVTRLLDIMARLPGTMRPLITRLADTARMLVTALTQGITELLDMQLHMPPASMAQPVHRWQPTLVLVH
jgi:hypothetical protein